jgi:histidinol-phosphate aminotransferase
MNNTIFNKKIKQLSPYVLSKRFDGKMSESWSFLDWNESNYPLPEFVLSSLKELVANGYGTAYPDGDDAQLNTLLAQYTKTTPDNILVFNGSDSALNIVIQCIVENGDTVNIIAPEYSQINTFIQMSGGIVESLVFENPFQVSIEDLLLKLDGKKILYLSNPNNPTGRFFKREDILRILETGVILLLDEAYVEFVDESCSDLVASWPNLFIFRTFSKAFGLAGFRIGYLITTQENIDVVRKLRNSKEINIYGQTAAKSALSNVQHYKTIVDEINKQREDFISFCKCLGDKLIIYDSSANFVVIRTENISNLLNFLENRRILIRDRSSMYSLNDCARVSIGTPDEMSNLKKAISDYFSAQ